MDFSDQRNNGRPFVHFQRNKTNALKYDPHFVGAFIMKTIGKNPTIL